MGSTQFVLVDIPDDLSFDDLHLEVDPVANTMEFDWAPLRRILEANGDLMLRCNTEISELLATWYGCLRVSGYRHEVAERYLVDRESGANTIH